MPWKSLAELLTTWLPFRYREERYTIGESPLRIRTPRFLHRLYDETAPAERNPGISEAAFPLVGIVWPSGEVLAELMHRADIGEKRILEIGCGMGLATHVLNRRGADVTAVDIHPVVSEYLAMNARLNRLDPPPFVEASWSDPDLDLGQFDQVIASDVLYEPRHSDHLAAFIARHAPEAVIVDPDRGQSDRFINDMQRLGFHHETLRPQFMDSLSLPYQVKIHHFTLTGTR